MPWKEAGRTGAPPAPSPPGVPLPVQPHESGDRFRARPNLDRAAESLHVADAAEREQQCVQLVDAGGQLLLFELQPTHLTHPERARKLAHAFLDSLDLSRELGSAPFEADELDRKLVEVGELVGSHRASVLGRLGRVLYGSRERVGRVRVLFSCTASDGHFMPLVPLARAFVARGDEVVFATAGGFADRVGDFGFGVLPAGLSVVELNKRYAPFRERLATIPFDERRAHAFAWRFAGLDAPAKVDALVAHARSWGPDLIVHESSDLAAPAVATALEVDSAHHTFGLGLPRVCLERAVPALESLWRNLGLEPEQHAGLFRGTYIDVGPPSLMPAEPPPGTQVVPLRPATRGSAPAGWQERLTGEKPVVYVTLGTQFNEPGRFALLLEALSAVDCTAVVTVGADQDPATLRPPPDTIVERYIPQANVLPLADAVICHGGSGSTLAALAHGLPLVLLPAGADQFENAGACSRAGTAIELRPPAVTVDSVRAAVTSVLEDRAYAEAAKGIAAEIERMLTPPEVAAILS